MSTQATWDEIMKAADIVACNAANAEGAFYVHAGAKGIVIELIRQGFKIVKEEPVK